MRKVLAWIESHNYCLVLLYFFFYMAVFTLEETFIRPAFIIDCPLDDLIPFNSLFIIPYFGWFILVPSVIGYFMFKSKDEFLDLCFMLFTGMTVCLAIYAVFPNGITSGRWSPATTSAPGWCNAAQDRHRHQRLPVDPRLRDVGDYGFGAAFAAV